MKKYLSILSLAIFFGALPISFPSAALELENSECREFFLINFNDYKSTNNKFFFTVESDGRCEYGMGNDEVSAFNECERFRQENNIGGKCEPFAVEDKIVWGKPELYAELTKSILGDSIFKVLNIPQEFKKAKNIYPKYISVFGIHIFASGKVRDNKIIHAANIMAEYLDNDEDGIPDNQKVVDKMVRKKAALLMSFSQDEWGKEKNDFFEIYGHKNLRPQSLYDIETNPGGPTFDASLEEVLHLITEKGYGLAYPKELGKTSSLLAKAMDKARGGKFKKVPKEYPEEAWYSYYDKGCTYRCMKAEYIYWALTSYLGAQKNRENMIGHEWKPNTKEKLILMDSDVVKIITDPKFKFPTTLPDGNYKPLISQLALE